jgi:hypothetical protein
MEKPEPVWALFYKMKVDVDCHKHCEYKPDEKGLYPYVVAAYKLKGDDFWHIGPFPAPFDNIKPLLKSNGIEPEFIRHVSNGGGVRFPTDVKNLYAERAYRRGWIRGYDNDKWYAPSDNVPVQSGFENVSEEQIIIKLIAIAGYWIELRFSQGEKRQYLLFEEYSSDGLPNLALLLKCLQDHGYGHMMLEDDFEDFFLALNIWSNAQGTAYMRFRYGSKRSSYKCSKQNDIQWDCKCTVNDIICNIRQLFSDILAHPDFISVYAYSEWRFHEEFSDRLEQATEEFMELHQSNDSDNDLHSDANTLVDEDQEPDDPDAPHLLWIDDSDIEDKFYNKWLRENILTLEPARERYELCKNMLENLEIPEGWLDLEDKL